MPVHTTATPLDRRIGRALALAGVVGQVLLLTVFTVAGLLRPGYSAATQAIGDLGVGPQAWMQNANFVAFGLLLLLFAVVFGRAMNDVLERRAATISGLLIAAAGIGLIGSAVFTAVPASEGLHFLLGFVLTFGSAMATAVLLGRQLRGVVGWKRFSRYSRLTGIGAVALLALSFVALNPPRRWSRCSWAG